MNDAFALALAALTATLTDERRAQRFLDLTGIVPDELRARAADPTLLHALLDFLAGYEPDLVDVAAAIGVAPEQLIHTKGALKP